jgi:hypothetical protein
MARPQRNNVDYFPFFCEEGKKMHYIEETYGNDGFATFLKILRELAKVDYHYLNLNDNKTIMFLSSKCKVSKDLLLNIITDLVELGKFDAVLWNENKIIWCQDFIDSIQDAYNKRKNECITYNGLILLLLSLGVRKHSKIPLKGDVNHVKVEVYPQTKEEETKENYIYLNIENFLSFRNSEFEKLLPEQKEKLKLFGINKPQIRNTNNSNRQYIDVVEVLMATIKDSDWRDTVCINQKITEYQFSEFIKEFIGTYVSDQSLNYDEPKFKGHFINWLKIKLK